jgi:hypothetical protein
MADDIKRIPIQPVTPSYRAALPTQPKEPQAEPLGEWLPPWHAARLAGPHLFGSDWVGPETPQDRVEPQRERTIKRTKQLNEALAWVFKSDLVRTHRKVEMVRVDELRAMLQEMARETPEMAPAPAPAPEAPQAPEATPAPPATPPALRASRRTGPRTGRRDAIAEVMRADLREGRRTQDELAGMSDDELVISYGLPHDAKRTTCRTARDRVLRRD